MNETACRPDGRMRNQMRDGQARTQRRTVQRTDHGLLALHDGVVGLAGRAAALPVVTGLGLAVGASLQVGARGEYLAGARQHRDSYLVAIADRVEDQHHLFHELHVLRVHGWVVHGDECDVVLDLALDEFGAHEACPLFAGCVIVPFHGEPPAMVTGPGGRG